MVMLESHVKVIEFQCFEKQRTLQKGTEPLRYSRDYFETFGSQAGDPNVSCP